jgi:Family of unknown function (DUF6370)
MKTAFRTLLAVAMVFTLVVVARAEEKKEVTLKGKISCTKCALKETEACGNAIVVEKDGKEITYYFDDKGKAEKYHKNICTGAKKGSVTGVVAEKDGKMYITPSKDGVKFD